MTQVYMHAGPVSHIIYNPLYYCNNRQKLGVTCIICNSNHVTEEAYTTDKWFRIYSACMWCI